MPRKTEEEGGKQRQAPSRIPPPKTGRYTVAQHHKKPPVTENGFEKADGKTSSSPDNNSSGVGGRGDASRRFETFVMTGDMIIQTTSPHHKPDSTVSSPSEKRTRDVKGSPVPSKKECKSNANVKASESKLPKSVPPKTAPKKAPEPVKERAQEVPESPKLSPKCDNKKQSPVKQSRLPRLHTPKGSPKASPKASPKVSPKKVQKFPTNQTSCSGTMDNEDETITIDILNANAHSDLSLLQGAQADTRPHDLELLGYTRYPDVPVELDIPPDDISSEDERYKHELVVDVDDLPPPPDEFFQAEMAVLQNNQEPLPPAPPSVLCLSAPLKTTIQASQPQILPQSVPSTNGIPIVNSTPQTNGTVHMSELPPPSLSPVREAHETGFDFKDMVEDDVESMSESDDPDSTARELDCLLESLPKPPSHHMRCASAGDKCYMDFDNHSTCSDSKLDTQQRSSESPVRPIVVSKSAEKIAPGKVGQSPTSKPMSSLGVRSSKSHENYLECNEVVTLVDIDLDENLASSVDALHYEKSSTSLDSLGYVQFNKEVMEKQHQETARSLDSSPDKHVVQVQEREIMPTFINLEEPRSISKIKEGGKLRDFSKPKEENSPTSSPSKSSARSGSSNNPGSPSKPSAIPVSSASRKPPRPPVRTAASSNNQNKSAISSATSPTSPETPQISTASHKEEIVSHHVCATTPGDTQEANTPPIVESPIIESPVHTATSHVVEMDLPTEGEEPMATSSTPPSPVPGSPPGATGYSGPENPEGEYDIYHQPVKDIDRPSAQRLAKRLFHLDGFKKGDVTRHLSKKNDFSFLVGEEFLKFFDFSGQTLDEALRHFLKNLTLAGETQERERVLAHFSRRYMETNPESYNSEDACHTLVCAMMLLNTDLHGQNIGRKMTVNEFIENLSDLNDGENFPREVLKNLYASIRNEPLECQIEDDNEDNESGSSSQRALAQDQQRFLGHNPFLDVPDPNKATEFKKGYVMRKCCIDPDGRKTPMGKRGWKMFYATLRDLVLYLHKDDHAFKKNTMVASATNSIRIHHALAYRATDYKKKQHVFRLQTADWAQYLFQTSNSKECQEWIDKINFVSASLSAPPLPGAVGSQRKFQRPLMPATYSRLNLREQALNHEQRVMQLEQELHDHRKYPPEKGAKSRVISDYVEKEAYLQFELKRFKVYSAMIQMKLATYPELEPSLVEVTIGEVDEPTSLPSSPEQPRVPLPSDTARATDTQPDSPNQQRKTKPVQRSQSDRPPSKVLSRHAVTSTDATITTTTTSNKSHPTLTSRQHHQYPIMHRHSTSMRTAAYETQV